MITGQQQFARSVQYVSDILVVVLAWLVAYPIRFNLIPLRVPHIPPFDSYAWLAFLALLVWAVVLRLRPLFAQGPADSLQRQLMLALRNHFLAFFMFVVLTVFVAAYKPSRVVLLIFLLISTIGIIIVRLALYRVQKQRFSQGKGLTRALIVGTGELARTLAQRLASRPEHGQRIIGFLTDRHEEISSEIEDIPVLTTVENVQEAAEKHDIQRVYVALPMHAHDRLRIVLEHLEDEMVDVKVVPDLMDYVVLRSSVEDFQGLPIISLKQVPISGWGAVAKRIFDVAFSLSVLVLGSPVFLGIALLVKLNSRGPVFYRQERMGLDGKVFSILKYRSMRMDAEKQTGAVWAVKDDPRRTKIGAFLRRTNLDEIPQFINVLRGEMSVVGPRPERPVFIQKFRTQIPKYMLRHKVKSGLTGWAQVNGWRGDTDLKKRIEYDLFYVENWTFWFDLRTIWLTLFSKESRKNAY